MIFWWPARFIDCGHDKRRGGLMHHVACIHDAPEPATIHLPMEARGLSICVDQAVLLARNNDDWHC